MKKCPFCGYSNYDKAAVCRKCEAPFGAENATIFQGKTYWIGPARAQGIRRHALFLIVLGLLMKVYWGGYGPWPTIDFPVLATIRAYAEPLLLLGGGVLYGFGWVAAWL